MTMTIRIILIIVSVLTTLYTAHKMRKSQMEIMDTVFWIVLSMTLVALSVFPQIAAFTAGLLGIYSELNLIYITFIFILILKLFLISIEVSKLKITIRKLIQEIALADTGKGTSKSAGRDTGQNKGKDTDRDKNRAGIEKNNEENE